MKKVSKIILIIPIIIIIICIITTSCLKSYPIGKDTLIQFDNGRYQILRSGPTTKKLFFYDMQQNKNIETDVYKYCEIKPNIYIVGEQGYTVLNYKTGKVEQSENLASFSKQEIEIFKNVKKFKNIIYK